MLLEDLLKESYATSKSKGWWDTERNFPEQLMLMVSELSETLEEYRKLGLKNFIYYKEASEKPEGIAIEIADLLIRVADTCEAYNIPIEEALQLKLAYNKTRPYRHGNKLA